jgi:hypothetical protein
VDLTALLLRIAARRPHVLVVAVPGATGVRLALEAALARRGWPIAAGPADADVLAVAGSPGPELAAVVDAVWEQVPAPRARIEVPAPADVDDRLDAAAALLAEVEHQRTQVVNGHEAHGGQGEHGERGGEVRHGGHGGHPDHHEHTEPVGEPAQHSGHAGHGSGHGGHPGRHEHDGESAEDHAGHGGGHHHGHGGMVAGLPMAELGPDRDGLTLDRLHLPLGPVLPDWPAGLVVRVTLQGDVIQEATAEVLDAGHAVPFEWPDAAARELDGLARFLGVAGWPRAAAQARRLRDAVLAGDRIEAEAAALARRIRRSRTLRWLIRGIPAGPTDVVALLAARLAAVEAAPAGLDRPGGSPAQLGDLLVGAELAAARLIVAALDPDTDRAATGTGAGHG